MGFRWFGTDDDPIPLAHIRQIPGVSNVVGALFDVPVGEVWPEARIGALKSEIEAAGLALEVVESVNISDAIKVGSPERDRHIDNYIATIENLSTHGVKVICYNLMPVFDWIRTDLRHRLPDGSYAMAYDQSVVDGSFEEVMERVASKADGFLLPGWEIERMAHVREIFAEYAEISEHQLAENLRYFLEAVLPSCERFDVRMALHPDDPPRPIFGLPRIVKNAQDMRKIADFSDSPYNSFTVCTGSLGENPENDVPAILDEFLRRDQVAFVHARNIRHTAPGVFHESAHLSTEGSLDMFAIMRTLSDHDYRGYVRPDHGRDIWAERGRPGYGLHDRALGISYLLGLWEAIQKSR